MKSHCPCFSDVAVALAAAFLVLLAQSTFCTTASAQTDALSSAHHEAKARSGQEPITITSTRTKSSRILSVRRGIGHNLSLGLSTEYFRSTSEYYRVAGMGEGPDWKFKGIPVTVSLERLLWTPDRRWVPFVRVGASWYVSQAQTRNLHDAQNDHRSDRVYNTQRGLGFGGQLELGVRSRLTRHTFVLAQGRYRIVDGLAIGASNPEAGRFAQLDFAVGVGVSF